LVHFGARIKVHPYTAHFRDGAEFGSLELVDKVAEIIGTFSKTGMSDFGLYLQLDLGCKFIIEADVDQEIVGTCFEAIFDSYYFHLIWTGIRNGL
jgi:hypothetical protein